MDAITTYSRPSRRGDVPRGTPGAVDIAAAPSAAAGGSAGVDPATDAIAEAQAQLDQLNAERPERLADVAEGVAGAQAALDGLDLAIGEAHAALQAAQQRQADEQAAASVLERRRTERSVEVLAEEQEELARRYQDALAAAREHAEPFVAALRQVWVLLDQDRALGARRQRLAPIEGDRFGRGHRRLVIAGDPAFAGGEATLDDLEHFMRPGNLDLRQPPADDTGG